VARTTRSARNCSHFRTDVRRSFRPAGACAYQLRRQGDSFANTLVAGARVSDVTSTLQAAPNRLHGPTSRLDPARVTASGQPGVSGASRLCSPDAPTREPGKPKAGAPNGGDGVWSKYQSDLMCRSPRAFSTVARHSSSLGSRRPRRRRSTVTGSFAFSHRHHQRNRFRPRVGPTATSAIAQDLLASLRGGSVVVAQ
jgi:hypothetical protein